MTREITISKYDPSWGEKFRLESPKLAKIFGDQAVGIFHIGSTSVPGLAAKPIIDILVRVKDIQRVDDFNAAMIELGYEPKGEYGMPGRRYFKKGDEEHHTFHVHAFQVGNPEIARHLNFCAYLRAHPQDAKRYAELKTELARQFPHDIEQYTNGKDAFIQDIDSKAEEWIREVDIA